jgi:hypothetical protein
MILSATLLLITVPTVQSVQLGRRAKPLRPLAELFTSEDYPVDAIIRKAEGRTGFELAIDSNGAPYSCRILEATKEPSLDRVACDVLMARAKFEPALDAKGRPVPDTYAARVVWVLPEDAPDVIPFEPSRRVVRVYSTAAGVSHCDLTEDDYAWPRLTRDQCLSMAGREVVDFAEQRKMTAPMTIIETFSPHGREAGKDEQAYGTVAMEMTAALRIGGDGEVTYCQPGSSKLLPDVPSQAQRQPNLCEDLKIHDWKFTPADDPAVVRSGQFTTRIYFGEGRVEENSPEKAR